MNSSPSSVVRIISDCFIKPQHAVEESKKPIYLPPRDLSLLTFDYIQKGLFFMKPQEAYNDEFMSSFLEKLKSSLSLALVHFYPLAGRLRTLKREDPHLYTVFVDCGEDSPGSRFIHVALDATISDILSPEHVPTVVHSFFDHNRAVDHDGHTLSLLSVQVTELRDGIFIGCSMNHSIVDGTSFWHFFNSWSEIHLAREGGGYTGSISRQPVLQRWFHDGCEVPINLPFSDPSEFIVRFESPVALVERFFHFSSETVAKLKAKANNESNTTAGNKISSFQALTAFVWMSITRARQFPMTDQVTSCRMAANNRSRMNPPISPDYFGNAVSLVRAFSATAGELLSHGLGWVAWRLHRGVEEHTSETLNQRLKDWMKHPRIHDVRTTFEPNNIAMTSSPRFNMYVNEFGFGQAVAVRSGCANKFDGKVTGYPGKEGGSSIDLEVCLPPETMTALESDEEFMAATTHV